MAVAAILAGGLQVAQGLYGGITGYRAGKKRKEAYQSLAQQAKEVGRLNVAEIERTGVEEQKSMADQMARRMARIQSMYSKSGLLLTGTPATAQQAQKRMDQYALNEHNQQVAFRAKIEKLMNASQVAQYQGQAKAAGMEAATALIGGLFGATQGGVQFGVGMNNWLQDLKKKQIPYAAQSAFNPKTNYASGWQA